LPLTCKHERLLLSAVHCSVIDFRCRSARQLEEFSLAAQYLLQSSSIVSGVR
ncbi:unnamed protein product, partial [Musa acuminata var. zebrina]